MSTSFAMKTLLAYQDIFLNHKTGNNHPENPDRLLSVLQARDALTKLNLTWVSEFPDAAWENLLPIHDQAYLQSLQETQGRSGYLDGDTVVSPKSYEAALQAAGAGVYLAEEILRGRAQTGFALVRPPGHHAERDHAMGFCLLNNVAVAAKYLISQGVQKVCILDWDVHHGNGTQDAFYEDSQVYFVSFHQYPYYPGTGSSEERGYGAGLGTTLNLPLTRGSTETDYDKAWSLVEKEMEFFRPEVYLISAGFDAHKNDPLGGMELTSSSFARFTERVKRLAHQTAKGRILSFLEGGYDTKALRESVLHHVEVLSG